MARWREMPVVARAPGKRPILASLPGGIWADGPEPVRHVTLRAVSSEDEVFLLDSTIGLSPAERATALLGRCIEDDEDGTVARSLTVGDREALLLQLHRLTFGDALECVLQCPDPACRERMEIELEVRNLLVPPYEDTQREYRLILEVDGIRHDIRFRLPTASDLDTVAAASSDPELGAAELLRACVTRATCGRRTVSVEDLAPEATAQIAAAMVKRDPQAELELDVSCPVCGHAFQVVLDTGLFLLQELDARAAQLLIDVHTLAVHYHWTERDILAMPPSRRERYLELLSGALQDSPVPDLAAT
jgi:hypothetical protein